MDRIIAMLALIFAFNYMDRQLLALLLGPIQAELGLTDTQAGLLYGFSFAVFYSFMGIPLARYSDRGHRVNLITWSLALFSAMTAATAAANTYVHLLLARIGVGVGEAGTSPASHSLIADVYPEHRRSTVMSIFVMGHHVGILLAFVMGGIVAHRWGWRAAFLLAGLAGLVVAVVAKRVLREPRRMPARSAQQPSIGRSLHDVWRRKSLFHVFVGGTVGNVAVSALLGWLPTLMMRSHEMSLRESGLLLAIVLGIFGGVATVCGGWYADRVGRLNPLNRMTFAVTVLLCSAAAWGLTLLVTGWGSLVALSIGGALISTHVGLTFAMVQSLCHPQARALTASLLLFFASLVGVGVGPLLVGSISDALASSEGVHSLRYAMMLIPTLFVWAALHYRAAASTLLSDMARLDHAGTSSQGDAVMPNPASG